MTPRARLLVAFASTLMTSVLVLTGPAPAATQSPAGTPAVLPPAITKDLDARFPRWTIAEASADSMAAWRSGTRQMPNVERGDFDGNGLSDYAVAVTYPLHGASGAGDARVDVVVFLRRGRSYRFIRISKDVGTPIEIRPEAKGARIHEYGEDRSFVLKQDAFTLSPGDAGPCYTYVYTRGRFASTWTCD